MIEKSQVMQMLVEACPSYGDRFAQFLANSYDEGDEPLLYCELSDFAHHLCDLLTQKKNSEFADVFAVVESLHIDGDAFVKEAATIGLLEGIQNVSSHRDDLLAEQFESFLKPQSAELWNELNSFWMGKRRHVCKGLQPPDDLSSDASFCRLGLLRICRFQVVSAESSTCKKHEWGGTLNFSPRGRGAFVALATLQELSSCPATLTP